jgi:hypothetical protein
MSIKVVVITPTMKPSDVGPLGPLVRAILAEKKRAPRG